VVVESCPLDIYWIITEAENDSTRTAHKKLVSGKLKINVIAAKNLLGKKSSKGDAYVVLRIDNVIKGKTKTKSKFQWGEDLQVRVDKAGEIEFTIYDKNDGLLGILFFRLSEVEQEALNAGLTSVSTLEKE
jgi:Ca2+-dependent lipid-binding protein